MEWWESLDRVSKREFSGNRMPMELGIPEIMEFYSKANMNDDFEHPSRRVTIIGGGSAGKSTLVEAIANSGYEGNVVILDDAPAPKKYVPMISEMYSASMGNMDQQETAAIKRILQHINGKRSFRDEYELVLAKKSGLTSACRKILIKRFENEKK